MARKGVGRHSNPRHSSPRAQEFRERLAKTNQGFQTASIDAHEHGGERKGQHGCAVLQRLPHGAPPFSYCDEGRQEKAGPQDPVRGDLERRHVRKELPVGGDQTPEEECPEREEDAGGASVWLVQRVVGGTGPFQAGLSAASGEP